MISIGFINEKAKKSIMALFVAFSTFVFGISCASFSVSVDSMRNTEAIVGTSVFIYPGDAEINVNDLLYKEFERIVEVALISQGFTIANDHDEADQIVFLMYGISDPQTSSVAIPQFGPTSVQSATTRGQATVQSNQIFGSSTTTFDYNYGITGYVPVQLTRYTRIIMLNAFDWQFFRNTEQLREIWRTSIVSTGSSPDLRRVFPYMIAASESYIGIDSRKRETLYIYEGSTTARKYLE